MMQSNKLLSPCSACASSPGCADQERRQLLGSIAAGGLLSSFPFWDAKAQEGAKQPMQLVDADAEADFKPLRPADLALGKPLLVFPFDVKTGTPHNGSRLNKLVAVRLPQDQMAPDTLARSASGVLAYSGICTHQGCEVKTWMAKEKVLACYCHASKFDLLDGAKVVSGPAPKPLTAVALAMDGEFLAIAPSSPPTAGQ
jgi:rieske iron-sulfur protein